MAILLLSLLNRRRLGHSPWIERRPEGDYAVRKPNLERASAIESTQAEAIDRARKMSPNSAIHIERVRHTKDGSPDKWRKI